ncbi:MAG TPA: thymidine phosphorylase [Thermoanaerobaculia bacterium]|nr:thymidine phosphorylase [Thermoanaerobaculia bacterium]
MSRPTPYEILNRKRRGEELPEKEIAFFLEGFRRGAVADYQMTAFLMAVAIRGMSPAETRALTTAVTRSGEQWSLRDHFPFIADKHSTGGVGDKVSLALAPWVAACGVQVGMLSGRGLGHTGGTLDKLETIPGFNAHLSRKEIVRCIERTGCAIATSTDAIAPADRRMYALRDVTGTVESLPLITASIMSKKLAFGASYLILDVKTGSGAFMSSPAEAAELARSLIRAAAGTKMKVEAMLTDMDQPLGFAIGNANEVIEAMAVLQGRGPEDVRELTRAQGERILIASGNYDLESAGVALDEALASGKALSKAKEWIEAQGGDPEFIERPELLGVPKHTLEVRSPRSGWLSSIDTAKLGMISVSLGAGRLQHHDPVDPAAGIAMLVPRGGEIRAGTVLAVLRWSRSSLDGETMAKKLLSTMSFADEPSPPRPLIQSLITEETE